MVKINIIYCSGTGNTEAMANLISEGAKSAGADVQLINVSDADVDKVKNADVIVLGSPAMGDEVLEEEEMEPFVENISKEVKGKKVALFGSYGWGDGQFMRDWVERMEGYGADLIGEGLIVQDAPEGETEDQCREFGKALINS
ncbi:flavodoxin short chain [Clostridium acetobutylicum]|uniref:Flavodoxin n=1 Tax=Clostridium acetobutylicum (strain ATCC 824 / DSM 792 / JCM 1419 / IAM 19013 / LMG 5710 / NBRC 13948 / NRRL B-527 / VKM B-1787 / 2291 / W) TaxID=272562 RepID=Q97LH4_CLOAB|nr:MULTISPECIES: flavodoxin [Clostridium]AAK78565.1 Flavodoxin [Clostridium acetobutylicum ATCC 824]ADZ19639.1 flavodoxin [Clostridium acetobutylicum EA 2018]AEI31324.1 flavodoxin [Clostridium acetobutylicum DSM 1731]AWV80289.1 flavodoxin [Clostridium acetobutylicum]MBC2392474.1 flavodoxin [Clostridium acetobutylicum]